MDQSIRLRTPSDPQVCEWCGTPLAQVAGQCSACGRTERQSDNVSERQEEAVAA